MIEWQEYDRELLAMLKDDSINSIVDMWERLRQKHPHVLFTYDAVQGRVYRLQHTKMVSDKAPSQLPYLSKYMAYITGQEKPEPKVPITEKHQHKGMPGRVKTLYAGDLHFPFEDEKAIDMALVPNLDADVFVTTELMDCYSLHGWGKKVSSPLEIEMDKSLRFLEYCSENFPLTYVVAANHEQRILRMASKRLPHSLLFLFNGNIMEILTRPFPNVIPVPKPWLKIGDVLYTHITTHSRIDLRAGFNVYQWYQEWADALELGDCNVMIQGHTHHLGAFYRPTKKIFEGGCLCQMADWWTESYHTKPWTQGYVTIIQQDGKAVLELCREHLITL